MNLRYLQLQALGVRFPDEKGGTLVPDRGCGLGNSLVEVKGYGQCLERSPLRLSSLPDSPAAFPHTFVL